MSNFITLQEAVQMTTLYRREMENILAENYKGKDILVFSETFDRSSFDALLAEEDCTSIRIYYGMSADLKIHAIGVGVNSDNEDILPAEVILSAAESKAEGSKEALLSNPPVIIENAIRCPDTCGRSSALNP